jgi:hypothetical protein
MLFRVIYLLSFGMQRFCFVLSVETLLGHLKNWLYSKTPNLLNIALNDPPAPANNCFACKESGLK